MALYWIVSSCAGRSTLEIQVLLECPPSSPHHAMLRSLVLLLLTGVLSSALVVKTSLGSVRGEVITVADGGQVKVFRGIPFAASTAGVNRWLPPQPRAVIATPPVPLAHCSVCQPWTDVLNATANGAGCYQPHHNPDVPCGGKDLPGCQSEDCLHLNIYCPASGQRHAVMFWIYGGAFNEVPREQ